MKTLQDIYDAGYGVMLYHIGEDKQMARFNKEEHWIKWTAPYELITLEDGTGPLRVFKHADIQSYRLENT